MTACLSSCLERSVDGSQVLSLVTPILERLVLSVGSDTDWVLRKCFR